MNKTISAGDFSERLYRSRFNRETSYPLKEETAHWINDMLGVLFPHFSNKSYVTQDEIEGELKILEGRLIKLLKPFCDSEKDDAKEKAAFFFSRIPEIYEKLIDDAKAIEAGDPAAESLDEVILTYPGFLCISIYRMAHLLNGLQIKLLPRLLTEYAHQLTGIDIHPGATIGKSFFIDHGTGIVIGETTIIGDNVKIYQGVTLGALAVDKNLARKRRHPKIDDNVVIYSGATILGGSTVIGANSVIGGNVWLTASVPPNSIVYHRSEVHFKNPKDNFPEPINFTI